MQTQDLEFHDGMLDVIYSDIVRGWRICRVDVDLDGLAGLDRPEVLHRAAQRHGLDVAVVAQAVRLFRGRPNVIGWEEGPLLRALGQIAAHLPGAEKPVLVATAFRVARLRSLSGHRSGLGCPSVAAFTGGARVLLDDRGVNALRRLLDRHVRVVPVRERLGTRAADELTQAELEARAARVSPRGRQRK